MTQAPAPETQPLRPADQVRSMLGPADLIGMQERAREIYVDPAVVDYAVRLVTATRLTFSAGLADLKRYISYGASPRASIALVTGARALAFLHGRDYVLPDDIKYLAPLVLSHRLIVSSEASIKGHSGRTVAAEILNVVPVPAEVIELVANVRDA